MELPTWKNTFNSDLKHWGLVDYAAHAAYAAGYRYLTWEGRVIALTVTGNKEDTGFSAAVLWPEYPDDNPPEDL